MTHEPRVQQISDALAAGGYHPFHAPCGILLVNPGLTAIANAIRVGEHIAERIGASIPAQAPAPRKAPGKAASTRTSTG